MPPCLVGLPCLAESPYMLSGGLPPGQGFYGLARSLPPGRFPEAFVEAYAEASAALPTRAPRSPASP